MTGVFCLIHMIFDLEQAMHRILYELSAFVQRQIRISFQDPLTDEMLGSIHTAHRPLGRLRQAQLRVRILFDMPAGGPLFYVRGFVQGITDFHMIGMNGDTNRMIEVVRSPHPILEALPS